MKVEIDSQIPAVILDGVIIHFEELRRIIQTDSTKLYRLWRTMDNELQVTEVSQ